MPLCWFCIVTAHLAIYRWSYSTSKMTTMSLLFGDCLEKETPSYIRIAQERYKLYHSCVILIYGVSFSKLYHSCVILIYGVSFSHSCVILIYGVSFSKQSPKLYFYFTDLDSGYCFLRGKLNKCGKFLSFPLQIITDIKAHHVSFGNAALFGCRAYTYCCHVLHRQ